MSRLDPQSAEVSPQTPNDSTLRTWKHPYPKSGPYLCKIQHNENPTEILNTKESRLQEVGGSTGWHVVYHHAAPLPEVGASYHPSTACHRNRYLDSSNRMATIWSTMSGSGSLVSTLLSWRTLALVFALTNLKSLHFAWFVRSGNIHLTAFLLKHTKT